MENIFTNSKCLCLRDEIQYLYNIPVYNLPIIVISHTDGLRQPIQYAQSVKEPPTDRGPTAASGVGHMANTRAADAQRRPNIGVSRAYGQDLLFFFVFRKEQ